MQTAQRATNIFILFTLLVALFPHVTPEDINRDGEVGLKDAILSTRAIAQSADHVSAFSAQVKQAVGAFQAAAGLKTVIKKSDDSSSDLFRPVFLVSIYNFTDPFFIYTCIDEERIFFISDFSSTDSPPPRFSLHLVVS